MADRAPDPSEINDALLGVTHRLVGDGPVKRLVPLERLPLDVPDIQLWPDEPPSLWDRVRQWWGRV